MRYDQIDETEGLKMEGLEGEGLERDYIFKVAV
jgi:hypothetical protein